MPKTILDYRNMPGVKDLPIRVGGHFALALKFEDEGDLAKANESLEKAIAAESEPPAPVK